MDAEEIVRRQNFKLALEMICAKTGKTKEYWWYIRRRNPDATISQIADFKKKMVRLLAFNYDVHRCPNPIFNARLKPSGKQGAEELRYPPEWKKEEK